MLPLCSINGEIPEKIPYDMKYEELDECFIKELVDLMRKYGYHQFGTEGFIVNDDKEYNVSIDWINEYA